MGSGSQNAAYDMNSFGEEAAWNGQVITTTDEFLKRYATLQACIRALFSRSEELIKSLVATSLRKSGRQLATLDALESGATTMIPASLSTTGKLAYSYFGLFFANIP